MSAIQRTLDWIIPLLQESGVPFYITGGFAAHLYGSTRPVNDIDIDIPADAIDAVLRAVTPFIESPLQRYEDSTWRMYGATLNYHGQLIDLSTDSDPRVRNKNTGEWDALEMKFDDVEWLYAYGHEIPVQNRRDLMSYKVKIQYDEEKHLADVAAVRNS